MSYRVRMKSENKREQQNKQKQTYHTYKDTLHKRSISVAPSSSRQFDILSNQIKSIEPSLLDVILTNRPRQFQRTQSIIDGISNVHATVVTTTKAYVQYPKCKIIKSRSYYKLNRQLFLDDLAATNLTTCHNVQDINDCWKMFNDGFRNVVVDHAPIKERKIWSDQLPFLNKHLRQSIWSRKRLYKKILTNRSDENWEAYRKQRNLCVDIRRKSIRSYFKNKFTDGKPSGATFWKTVKPFITNKGHQSGNDLILSENGNIVHDSKQVADNMNTYYINVAAHIGEPSDNENEYIDHPSIKSI